jgi:hypothetical protein
VQGHYLSGMDGAIVMGSPMYHWASRPIGHDEMPNVKPNLPK